MNAIRARREADEVTATDIVVIGSGVAGLTAALGLACSIGAPSARPRSVTVLTKTELAGGSSRWAQGGVAAALAVDDSPDLHAEDTVAAGAGLGDRAVIEALTAEGPERIRRLMELGARFDRGPDGGLLLGREGAHSRRRILHAGGDATGHEMVRALIAEVRRHPDVDLREWVFALDLVTAGDRVVGVLARHPSGRVVLHRARAVVLATGGFGQLYERTTNPVEATGDGLAMAARAGARLADLEMVQFHPTALDAGGGLESLPLVTEALRGEGAILVDDRGERFMLGVCPRAELGPRDVVARAIRSRQQAGRRVFLDASGAIGAAFPERFPTVWDSCRRLGLDPRCQPIPVTPAAHYAMAGIAVDLQGRSSLPGLWACGEVTSTGVHGANRLASNSLLEALVFGARVADDLGGATTFESKPRMPLEEVVWREEESRGEGADGERARTEIRRLMWRHVGLERDRRGLETALEALGRVAAPAPDSARACETRNLLTLGRLVAAAALARRESRGSHYRADFPESRKELRHRFFWTYRPEVGCPLAVASSPLGAREIA